MAGFVARESPKLAEAMAKVVDLPDELQPSRMDALGIDLELDGKFKWLVQNNLEQGSKASTLARTLKGKPGLEVWRRLSRDAKPQGGAQETLEMEQLAHPSRAKGYKDFEKDLLDLTMRLDEAESSMGEG